MIDETPEGEQALPRGIHPVRGTNKDGREWVRFRVRISTKLLQADRLFEKPEEAERFLMLAKRAISERKIGWSADWWEAEAVPLGPSSEEEADAMLSDLLARQGMGLSQMEAAVARATARLAAEAKGNRSLSREHLAAAARISSNTADFARRLGYNRSGGNYRFLRDRAEGYGIDLDAVFSGKARGRGSKLKPDDIGAIFRERSTIDRGTAKRLLVEWGLKEYRCQRCDNGGEWNGMDLTLQLEHDNGIHDDYRLENLKFLCPNCHSQTPTYAGKNRKYRAGKFIPAVCGGAEAAPGSALFAPMCLWARIAGADRILPFRA